MLGVCVCVSGCISVFKCGWVGGWVGVDVRVYVCGGERGWVGGLDVCAGALASGTVPLTRHGALRAVLPFSWPEPHANTHTHTHTHTRTLTHSLLHSPITCSHIHRRRSRRSARSKRWLPPRLLPPPPPHPRAPLWCASRRAAWSTRQQKHP